MFVARFFPSFEKLCNGKSYVEFLFNRSGFQMAQKIFDSFCGCQVKGFVDILALFLIVKLIDKVINVSI